MNYFDNMNIECNFSDGNLTVALSKCWTYGYQTTFNFRDFDRSANSMIWTFQMTEDAYKVYCQDKLVGFHLLFLVQICCDAHLDCAIQ